MSTTLPSFKKQIGNVGVEITEETVNGKVSHNINFTCRQDDGTETQTFRNEGDLAQLGMALWRAQEYLNQHRDN